MGGDGDERRRRRRPGDDRRGARLLRRRPRRSRRSELVPPPTAQAISLQVASARPRYTLPDLDYDFGALEPHLSGRILELHHGKHHAGYVQNTNLTIALLEEARAADDFTRLAALEHA